MILNSCPSLAPSALPCLRFCVQEAQCRLRAERGEALAKAYILFMVVRSKSWVLQGITWEDIQKSKSRAHSQTGRLLAVSFCSFAPHMAKMRAAVLVPLLT